MEVLLVGGTGVLSSAITTQLLKLGIGVSMINRGSMVSTIPSAVNLIKSDKNDYALIKKHIQNKKIDAVIDFLCYTEEEIIKSFNFYSRYTNQYVFISSCAVYNTANGGIMTEDSEQGLKIWKYSIDKVNCEKLLIDLAKEKKINYTIVRPCVTYGDTRIPYGISPRYGYHWTLAARILAGKPIIRWNGGINRCNMTHVDDFAVGIVGLIGNPKAYNEAFNICGEECPSFNDVLDIVAKYLDKEVIFFDVTSEEYAKELPSRSGEILGGRSIDAINSNEKIKSVVPSFKQDIGIFEGVCKTLDAYKFQNYQNGIDWTFDADTDRIIKKYSKKRGINTTRYNLRFVNYLGTASKKDYLTYWFEFHKDNKIVFVLKKFMSYGARIMNKIRKF